MSKNAICLALEALETNNKAWKALADSGDAGFWEAEEQPFYELSVKAITALREALAENDAVVWGVDRAKAQQALDKKAENARELGLDYEPAQQEPLIDEDFKPDWMNYLEGYSNGVLDGIEQMKQASEKNIPPAQQEPVAWGIVASNTGRICQVELDADEVEGHNPKHIVPLYTSPPAQQEPFGYFQYDIRLDAWVQNRVNNKGVAFYIKEQK